MKIVDAIWLPVIVKYEIQCDCGRRFKWPAGLPVRCPQCGATMEVEDASPAKE